MTARPRDRAAAGPLRATAGATWNRYAADGRTPQ